MHNGSHGEPWTAAVTGPTKVRDPLRPNSSSGDLHLHTSGISYGWQTHGSPKGGLFGRSAMCRGTERPSSWIPADRCSASPTVCVPGVGGSREAQGPRIGVGVADVGPDVGVGCGEGGDALGGAVRQAGISAAQCSAEAGVCPAAMSQMVQ